MSSTEPTTSTTDRPTSNTTSRSRATVVRRDPDSARSARRSTLDVDKAGARPKTTGATIASAAANSSTGKSIRGVANSGRAEGAARRRIAGVAAASAMPSAAPRHESRSASVSSCRTSRVLPAPSARRTAISRIRLAPRPSCRLATFAQTMRKRTATAPKSMRIVGRASAAMMSCSGSSRTPIFVFVSGYARSSSVAMAVI